ncbi:MAG: T9SS type A sorting domain-containing protein [Bacteroidota bacterium]
MKILSSLNQGLGKVFFGLFLSFLAILSNPSAAQQITWGDNPNLDQIPRYLRLNPPKSPSVPLSSVITVNNWDNFNLGTDFGESNIAAHMQSPFKFFTAYNTNAAHHTENGVDWANVTPNFGATMQGDPVVTYDSLGNLFYENMYGSSSILGVKVMKSTDNGVTWGTAVTAVAGVDKNWLACDQTNGPYANYVYACMTANSGGNFARSTDHGVTWTNTFTPNTQSVPGMMVAVGPNGNVQGGAVYVVTSSGSSFTPTYTFYKSNDGGANFTQTSAVQWPNTVGTQNSGRNSVMGMRTRPYPWISADNSYGAHRGRFYCIYASNDPPGNNNKPDIWCRYSDDFGTTWSSAKIVNDDANPQSHNQWHCTAWCDKETGRLYAMWMDTRDTPTNDSAYMYASYSDNGGQTWVANQRISNKKMKIDCPTCGGGGTPRYQGDYNGIVSNKKGAMAGWTDFRNGSFMSATAYFPDFAMALDHNSDTLYTPIDSAAFIVSIPEVKLYSDTVVLSGTVTPVPTGGTISFHFPQGNKITSYPGTKQVNVVLSGNVPNNIYQAIFKATGPNGTPAHTRIAQIRVMQGNAFVVMASATPGNICEGQSSQLNANVIGGVAPYTYSWTPQTGLNNSNIANPIATPSVTTYYHVTVSDNASHVTNDSVLVAVGTAPGTPGPIAGSQLVCLNTSGSYSITDVQGATSYSWTVPAGDTITGGQNTPNVTILWRTGQAGNISVIAGNNCGNSTPSVLSVTVQQGLAALGAVHGPGTNCKNIAAIYSVAPVAGAESYSWTVPQSVTITSGQSTDSIHVNWGAKPGTVMVRAINHCDTTDWATLVVGVDSVPLAAGAVTGNDSVCLGHNGYIFSVQDITGAQTYDWTLPAGFTINGTQNGKQITVDISMTAVTGSVSVKGHNTCGTGTESSKNTVASLCGGIGENHMNNSISVYPNPAENILNIAFRSQFQNVSMSFTDVKGQEILKQSFNNIQNGNIKQVDVSRFAKGIYFIQFRSNDQVFTEKVIVQ